MLPMLKEVIINPYSFVTLYGVIHAMFKTDAALMKPFTTCAKILLAWSKMCKGKYLLLGSPVYGIYILKVA